MACLVPLGEACFLPHGEACLVARGEASEKCRIRMQMCTACICMFNVLGTILFGFGDALFKLLVVVTSDLVNFCTWSGEGKSKERKKIS